MKTSRRNYGRKDWRERKTQVRTMVRGKEEAAMTLSLTGAVANRPRPRGSKKKPIAPSTGISEISDKMKTRVLEVPSDFVH